MMLERALPIIEKALGSDHPTVGSTYNNLAALSIAQAFCAASVLTGAAIVASLIGFAVAGVLRAGLGYAAERAGFAASGLI